MRKVFDIINKNDAPIMTPAIKIKAAHAGVASRKVDNALANLVYKGHIRETKIGSSKAFEVEDYDRFIPKYRHVQTLNAKSQRKKNKRRERQEPLRAVPDNPVVAAIDAELAEINSQLAELKSRQNRLMAVRKQARQL